MELSVVKDTLIVRGAKMLKTLFGKKYTKAFVDRVKFRRAEYYEKRRIQTIRDNAMKMAHNWSHEYPTGTPLEYIRDDIIEMWERHAKVGIFSNLDAEQYIPVTNPISRMDIIGQNGNDGLHYDANGSIDAGLDYGDTNIEVTWTGPNKKELDKAKETM